LTPTITIRESSLCVTASAMTLGSNCPNDTFHFCATGRRRLVSSSNRLAKSTGSTIKRSVGGGANTGAHNSESRETTCSGDDEISERHSVSKNLMRNKVT